MRFKTETYKGIAIRCVQKVIGGKPWVVGSWAYKGKQYSLKGNTKDYVLTEAKKRINRII